jgi:hypothetical protein
LIDARKTHGAGNFRQPRSGLQGRFKSRLISRHLNADFVAAIAREYGKGRLLLIGTTNLDVQRPVIWNIGAIAASGKPGDIS